MVVHELHGRVVKNYLNVIVKNVQVVFCHIYLCLIIEEVKVLLTITINPDCIW